MTSHHIESGEILGILDDGFVEYLASDGPIDLDPAHTSHFVEAKGFLDWCQDERIAVPAPNFGYKHRYATWKPSSDDLAKIKAWWF